MPSQKEIRLRIASTISTQQITKAMKLVSATKLRKATDRIVKMRPYALKLKGILANLSDSVDDEKLAPFFKEKAPENILLVVITSDRGLCGGFNANVIKRTRVLLDTIYSEQSKKGGITILPVGKKGFEYFKKSNHHVISDFVNAFQQLDSKSVFEIGESILTQYTSGKFDKVELIFNQFKNAATQIIINETLLPVQIDSSLDKVVQNDYIFEPGKVEILEELVPRSLKTQLYRAMLDSSASEHGARMVAMEKATENAGDLLKGLRLEYNQARQASITRELSEIVGGAAALQG